MFPSWSFHVLYLPADVAPYKIASARIIREAEVPNEPIDHPTLSPQDTRLAQEISEALRSSVLHIHFQIMLLF